MSEGSGPSGFGYADWSELLAAVVTAGGKVDYEVLRERRASLAAFVGRLGEASPESDPARFPTLASRLAYWINAYNAVTIRGILREYPTTSIRNHTAKALGYNIWKDLLLVVDSSNGSVEPVDNFLSRRGGSAAKR